MFILKKKKVKLIVCFSWRKACQSCLWRGNKCFLGVRVTREVFTCFLTTLFVDTIMVRVCDCQSTDSVSVEFFFHRKWVHRKCQQKAQPMAWLMLIIGIFYTLLMRRGRNLNKKNMRKSYFQCKSCKSSEFLFLYKAHQFNFIWLNRWKWNISN